MNRLLIVEDDPIISSAIEEKAKKWNFEVESIKDFTNIIEEFKSFKPDLVLLDLYLPYFDGYYWCNKIREISNIPIIFISSADEKMNIIMAVNSGADDYIIKPFDLDVLIAKLNALIRRANSYKDQEFKLEYNGLILNRDDQSCEYSSNILDLSKNEFKILQILLENNEKIVSREKLMEELWKDETFVDDNTLSVNVNRLRRKLKTLGLDELIKTKVGSGYILKK